MLGDCLVDKKGLKIVFGANAEEAAKEPKTEARLDRLTSSKLAKMLCNEQSKSLSKSGFEFKEHFSKPLSIAVTAENKDCSASKQGVREDTLSGQNINFSSKEVS